MTPEQVLKRNRDRAAELAQRAGLSPTRKLLQSAADDLARRIAAAPKAGGEDPFTLTQLKVTLHQVQQVLHPLLKGMRGVVVSEAKVAAQAAASGSLDYLRAAEQRFSGVNQPLPFREAAVLDPAVAGAEASVLRRIASDPDDPRRPGVLARYGGGVIDAFEEQLRLRFVARKPWGEVRDELTNQSPFLQGKPAYWAERVVRTEVMGAANRANWETIRRADAELGDMVKILSCVIDGRTGADSIAVHGQIRRPEEAFESWFGLFQSPPDRPNDRAVVVPHRVAWPIPAELRPRSMAEVVARWVLEGRKGSPPGQPLVSTVDLSLFGRPQQAPEPTREAEPEGTYGPLVGGPPTRLLQSEGIADEDLQYNRGGMREMRGFHQAFADAEEQGISPTELAASGHYFGPEKTYPIRITTHVNLSGEREFHLDDGRHRYTAARAAGAKAILARVVEYGPRGGLRSDREVVVKLKPPKPPED